MPANSLARRNLPRRAVVLLQVILGALAGALATTVAAAQARHPITVEDMWAVKRPGAPSLSPDGRWAAVELTTYDMKENNST